MIDIENLLKDSLKVIRSTSDFIKSQVDQVSSDDIEEKDINSLVSYVDKEAEHQLVNGLRALLPESGFITEEDTMDQKGKEYTWIIDPLDGTTNFLNRVPHFAISVALQRNNKTILGIVKEVNSEEEWTAMEGKGSFLNNKRIKVSTKPYHEILIATGFPYSNDHDYEIYFNILKHWLTQTRGIRRFGAAALDLCYVACGRYGAYYESTLNAKEAGGHVSDYSNTDNYLFGGEILAASPEVYAKVLKIIQSNLNK